MHKQSWKITLDVLQECDEDMSGEDMEVWINSHFKDCDYGTVRCADVQCTELTLVTINVASCVSLLGFKIAMQTLVISEEIDTSKADWVYKIFLTEHRRYIMENLVDAFGCTISYN